MISRRHVLGAIPSLALASRADALTLRRSILDDRNETLRQFANERGIVYGSAASSQQLQDGAFADMLAREAGLLVPEYEMKRGVVEAVRGQYDFSGCEVLASFAKANGMGLRGHPLVWHKRNPDWLEQAALDWHDEGLLTSYVAAVVTRFKGRVHSWDVVNEAVAPAEGRKDNLRNSFWLKAFGPSYIDTAYHAARAADPDALLVYNDWGCEAGGSENDRFRAATLSFLEQARARGVPIDALGLQGHLSAFGPSVDQRKLASFLDNVRSLGLRVLVTELDVDDTGGPNDTAARDRAVADAARRFLDVMLSTPATIAVLSWGLSDRFLDSPNWRQRLAGYSPRMLPLDANLNRKPLWHALAQSFGATPER